jgi:hypothetical protein
MMVGMVVWNAVLLCGLQKINGKGLGKQGIISVVPAAVK